jgi:DNA mismatch repair protein MSH2
MYRYRYVFLNAITELGILFIFFKGHRLLAQYLRQPLVDKDKLEERYDLVEIFMQDILLREVLYEEHLRRVPDCQTLSRKFLKQRASLQDCYK